MSAIPASHQDLLNTAVATLATVGADGYPQVTALWFLLDDDGVVKLSLNTSRQKLKNLQKSPECTLFIIDPANPFRTLEIRANAKISPDPDYLFADKIGRKYGVDVRTFDQPGVQRVVVALEPVKINTYGAQG